MQNIYLNTNWTDKLLIVIIFSFYLKLVLEAMVRTDHYFSKPLHWAAYTDALNRSIKPARKTKTAASFIIFTLIYAVWSFISIFVLSMPSKGYRSIQTRDKPKRQKILAYEHENKRNRHQKSRQYSKCSK